MSDATSLECPFCNLGPDRRIEENELAVALADTYPVSPGHTLVVPRRHVPDFFQLSAEEIAAVFDLVRQMRDRLIAARGPSGFNVGVNVGTAAGQTVVHAHVHLIPRYSGDAQDPTGGVRNVIPGKGRYA